MFGKRTDDEQWARAVLELAQELEPIWSELQLAAQGSGDVSDSGPLSLALLRFAYVPEIFQRYDQRRKLLERRYKAIGKPNASGELLKAKKLLDESFASLKTGIIWGKRYLDDYAGAAGRRAATETGFVQKAAEMRVTSKRARFEQYTLAACHKGEEAVAMTRSWVAA